jgi:hypothetical protein
VIPDTVLAVNGNMVVGDATAVRIDRAPVFATVIGRQ